MPWVRDHPGLRHAARGGFPSVQERGEASGREAAWIPTTPRALSTSAVPAVLADVTASAILMLIRGAPAAAASSGRVVAPGPMPKNSVFPLEPGTDL